MRQVLDELPPGHHGEVVFVDDASGDGSLAALEELREADPERVKAQEELMGGLLKS